MHHNVRQIDAIDARHRWRVRAMTFFGAAFSSLSPCGPRISVSANSISLACGMTLRIGGIRSGIHRKTSVTRCTAIADSSRRQQHAIERTAEAIAGTGILDIENTASIGVGITARGRNAREGTARLGTHPENPQTYAAGAILANGARLTRNLRRPYRP